MKKFIAVLMIVGIFLFSACNSNIQDNQSISRQSEKSDEQENVVNEISFEECIEQVKKELMSQYSNNGAFVRELFEEPSSDDSPFKLDPLFTISEDKSCLYAQSSNDIGIDGIFKMNLKLGFSEALKSRMSNTRAIDGTQIDENNKFKVSWTYHPDDGLSVIYERKITTN